MKTITLVGTLHGGLTPKNELEEVLEGLKPDQLFVELTPNELKEIENTKSIRDEMIFALRWAKKNGIKVDIFDRNEGELKKGATGKEPAFLKLLEEGDRIIKKYSWKELNKEEPWKTQPLKGIEDKINEMVVDAKKAREREEEMIKNIKEKMISSGKIVILTGAGHLTFFEKRIPNAVCLFR